LISCKARGWLNEHYIESNVNEKGRPLKIYALRVTIDEIVTVIIGSYYNSCMELWERERGLNKASAAYPL